MRDVLLKIANHAPARRLLYVGIELLGGRVHASAAVCEIMTHTSQRADGRRREIHSKIQANFLLAVFGYTACLPYVPADLVVLN